MSLLKTNEIQVFSGTTVTITATTAEVSADLNVGADLDVTGALTLGTALAITEGGTGATDAATARTNLDVDQAGTDNSTDVTLVTTSHDYLSITGQAITLGPIDLAADVTGTLATSNGGTGVASLGSLDAADLGSGTATDGYVLTADGSGGVAWEEKSPIDLLSSGASIRKSDGTTAVLSESGGTVTLENTSLGDTVLMPDNSNNVSTAPGIRFEADTDTGIGLASAGNLAVVTGGTERMRIDSSGNVGIGTSPDGLLNLKHVTSSNSISEDASDYALTFNFAGAIGDYGRHIAIRDDNGDAVSVIGGLDEGLGGATGLYLATGNTSGISERMRITSSGNVGIGNTATINASGGDIVKFYQNRNGGTPYWYFNTSGSYGVYSDERLKENITATEQTDSVEFIKNLQAVEFNWKSSFGDTTRRISGLIAQNVLASAKTEGQKNILTNWETYDENDPDCPKMGLSDHRMIPSIVQALQVAMERIESQQSQIDALTARIEALEV